MSKKAEFVFSRRNLWGLKPLHGEFFFRQADRVLLERLVDYDEENCQVRGWMEG